jgi:(1->4)-alpha-D-glucan 1-alpha-D-glucosylmutase
MGAPERGASPLSTYRLQVTSSFDLHAAAALVPHLHELGVDWVYLSPILEAERGSDHGYDVVRHDRVDPARGGADGLAALSAAAHDAGMGVLVDIVPNHVGVATPPDNPLWWDLLTHGRGSAYASWFDVDWDAGDGTIQVPVVGDDDAGSIRVDTERGVVTYHDNTYPLAPGTTTLEEQHYRLVSWREADAHLNYRRFFAVNTLAAIRVEDPEVFAGSHAEVGRWFEPQDGGAPLADGLRVDHPDGLLDPQHYLDDLAALTGGAYVLVEKILEPGEELPSSWATAGTTGYDALALVDRVLVDPAGQERLDALETRLRGSAVVWEDLVHDRKRDVADGILHSEVLRVTRELAPATDLGPAAVADAVAEVIACFGVYRSYLQQQEGRGEEHLAAALAAARERRPDLADALDVVGPLLADPVQPAALRLQQTSGMVMAKGVEDCSFYRFSRLTSLDEVGGDPSVFAVTVDDLHAAMAERQRSWPTAMTCTTTHDTKRGEDTRARISVLAEVPDAWATALGELLRLAPVPDAGFGALLWQAVLGAWSSDPDLRSRLHGYAEKAMREAGDHTQWTAPDEAYEQAVHAAVDAAFDDAEVRRVLDGLLEQVVDAGWSNALSAKLLALTIPGVPDVYQGSELWEQSLVDPDNRRPVDHDARRALLAAQRADGSVPAPRGLDDDGAAKLLVTSTALRLKRERPELFTTYDAVAARGSAADHVVALDRGGALTVVTRLPLGLAAAGGWGDTALSLPEGSWTDALTGRPVAGDARLADLLSTYPVALLVKE